MRASIFNISAPFPETDEILLFNTSTGALISVPSGVGDLVGRLTTPGGAIGDISPATLAELTDLGFVLPDGADEVGAVIERNRLGIADPNRLDVFILPNMNCNFACPYCYEEHAPSRLDEETERRIISWFETNAPNYKVVLLSWFGGEPLLSFETVLRIQRRVHEICRDAGVTFNSHITTNGYLLTPERAEALCAADLLSYQITIDGPPDVHNVRRVLKGPGDSFERVFGNLCALARADSRANIKLRVNFDATTIERIPELLEMVPKDIRPRLHPVLERLFDQGHLFIGKSPRWIAQKTEEAYDAARRLGFAVTTTPLVPERLTYCYADRESQVLFTHRGDVFKCTVSEFRPDQRLGFLDDDGRIVWEGTRHQDWMDVPALDDDCMSCTYLPMCMGGCRKNRAESGHAGADCTLPFAALDERIRQRYAAQLATSVQSA